MLPSFFCQEQDEPMGDILAHRMERILVDKSGCVCTGPVIASESCDVLILLEELRLIDLWCIGRN